MKQIAILSRSLSKGKICLVHQAALTALICVVAAAASAQTDKPPEAVVKYPTVGPTREIKLAENTWMRFGFQVQTWVRTAQDSAKQADGSDGGYATDFYCRRCRLFTTGSIVKDVTYNVLFEAGNFGRADPASGSKGYAGPTPPLTILDAYGMIRFHDAFQIMAGSMVVPLTRNGNQPTTTYLPIDVGFTSATLLAAAQLNVLRDLGVQADGYLAENHFEYRVGVFQGLRAPAGSDHSASHNGPLVNVMLKYDFWDAEVGYVVGGHYYGTKKVVGLFGSFQYQQLRHADPPAGVDKNPFWGASGAAFLNYPLSGEASPQGGDELAALVQFNYYDGGRDTDPASTKAPTYPGVPKQFNLLAEAAYYNKDAKFSVFGKFEMRQINSSYSDALKAGSNLMWIAGGVKYFIAPANICNIGVQYERLVFNNAPSAAQSGTNTVTAQFQFLLY